MNRPRSGTGEFYHAAVGAGVRQGQTIAIVGDGAVGLSGVLATKLLGATSRRSLE